MEKILNQSKKKNKHLYAVLSKYQQLIIDEPFVGAKLKADLKKFRSLDFKFKGIDLRICYAYYEENDHIEFVYAGTRENFYDEVKRYVKNSVQLCFLRLKINLFYLQSFNLLS